MKKLFPRLLLLALAILLAGCNLLPDTGAKPRGISEQSIWAMDTQMDLRLYGDTDGTCMAKLTALLNELDHQLSATDPDSELSVLNESGFSEQPRIVQLLENATFISGQTDGALDVTLLPVSRAWGFTMDKQAVPDTEVLETLRDRVGMNRLTLKKGESVSLSAGTQVDLGALAKGYAADLCRAEMEAAGISGILSLGGNIQTVGKKPDGSPWVIGIEDPNDTGRYLLTLRVTGSKAVVASGDYQRYFLQDGIRYCHIIDPATLSPVQGSLRSVTVVADNGLLADALSTALFVMGRESGETLWRARKLSFEAVWIEADGTVWVTPELAQTVVEGACQVIES